MYIYGCYFLPPFLFIKEMLHLPVFIILKIIIPSLFFPVTFESGGQFSWNECGVHAV
jgi:hypothetical protein